MRDIFFISFMVLGIFAIFRDAYIGVMLWVLLSIMNPHTETYLAQSVQWNLIVAIVTIGVWILSPERKLPPTGATTILVFLLLSWTTFNNFFSFDPPHSWYYWNIAWKTVAMAAIASAMTVSMVRFHALMWVVTLSLGYFGVKGGLFTLLTGGHYIVFGPGITMIADNNSLAGALVMILPIMNYLRAHSESRPIRIGMIIAIVLTITSILGSYSRGAFIGLAVLSVAFWLRTKNKILFPVLAAIVLLPLLHFMPESFYQRAASIQDYSTDTSIQGRFDSWFVAYHYAMDHFPFGAGFYGLTLPGVWAPYMSGTLFAAHSIYFQVLGEQGVIGLALYLLIIASTFLNFRAVKRNVKGVPDFLWASDLADMMQLSFMGFCVCGAALPIDFFDLFFLWAMLSASLRMITRDQQRQSATDGSLMRVLHPRTKPLSIPPT